MAMPRASVIVRAVALAVLAARAEWKGVPTASEPPQAQEEAVRGEGAGHVVTFSDAKDFERRLKDTERMAVMFHAPWCDHCRTLEPQLHTAASHMKNDELVTVMGLIDGTKQVSSLTNKYAPEGYPSVPYFVWGKHNGFFKTEPTAAAMTAAFKEWERHSIAETPAEHYDTFLANTPPDQFAVIARVKEGSARAKAYREAVTGIMQDYEVSHFRFALVSLPKQADPKKDATLSILRAGFTDHEEALLTYAGGWTGANIARWAKQSAYPEFGTSWHPVKYSRWAMQDMHSDGVVVAVTDDDVVKFRIVEALRPLAAEFKSWRFTSSDAAKLDERERRKLGVVALRSWPAISVLLPSPECEAGLSHCWDTQLFVYKDVSALQSTSSIRSFLSDAKQRRTPRTYRSAVLPTGVKRGKDADSSVVLVGDTFERDVFDPTADVFVFFYSPNSTRCDDFRAAWASLAEAADKRGWRARGVTLAKIDASDNESPEAVVEIPKLVLYRAVEAKMKLRDRRIFNGKRNVDAMMDFLLENAKNLADAEDEL